MAHPRLSHPSQPLALRGILRLYEFLASLKLAVILIFSVACVLALATFIEANYGTAGVAFYVYHTTWFSALLALLAVNIFCAASIRYPWKRHQTGFVITHAGLLVLLFGSALSSRGSVNSQLLVYLGGASRIAIDHDQSSLVLYDLPGRPEPLKVGFSPGPFNWQDLAPSPSVRRIKSWIGLDDASQEWVHPPETIYEAEGTTVEIVDYYSRSKVRRTPYLELAFRQPALDFEIPIELEFDNELQFAEKTFGGGIGKVMAWRARDQQHLQAFRECTPTQTVAADSDGAVVIWWKGEVYHLTVSSLQKFKEEGTPFELGDGLSVELVAYSDSADLRALVEGKGLISRDPAQGGSELSTPAVELAVVESAPEQPIRHRIIRFGQFPFTPNRTQPDGFLAEFYHPSVSGRIDILIGPDDALAYRAWQQKAGRVVAAGNLTPGEEVTTWSMGGGEMTWKMTLERYIPASAEEGNVAVIPLPFDKDDNSFSKQVKLRIRYTDPETGEPKQDAFWLSQNLPPPWERTSRRQVHATDIGRDKPVRAAYNVTETDIGFALMLVDFDLDVDPGTRMAANYTSRLVQIDVRNSGEMASLFSRLDDAADREQRQQLREELTQRSQALIDEHVAGLQDASPAERESLVGSSDALQTRVITMNEPLDYPDWRGRQLRFFQENYLPPSRGETPLGSIFRVNYDPGRPAKYLGSSLIVLGIFLMFYMRAYFFKKPDRAAATVREAAMSVAQ